jgi:hypothetical protein
MKKRWGARGSEGAGRGPRRGLRRRAAGLVLWGGCACLLAAAALPAAAYEQRPNTFSLGMQGGAGILSGQDEYVVQGVGDPLPAANVYPYDKFDWGGALSIRLRYALDPTHAFGVSMEDLRFRRISGQSETVNLGSRVENYPKQFQAITYMLDYYFYPDLEGLKILGKVGRRYKNCPYFVIGAGLQRNSFRFSSSDIMIPPLGFAGNAGLGWEYFIHFALRGYYLRFSGGSGVAGEASLGFQYYLLR